MIDPFSMPVVQDALERHRLYFGDKFDQRLAHFKNNCGVLTPAEVAREIQDIADMARDLGALEGVCAIYGITKAVRERKL